MKKNRLVLLFVSIIFIVICGQMIYRFFKNAPYISYLSVTKEELAKMPYEKRLEVRQKKMDWCMQSSHIKDLSIDVYCLTNYYESPDSIEVIVLECEQLEDYYYALGSNPSLCDREGFIIRVNGEEMKNNLELIAELISKETVPDPYLYNKANSCKIYYVIKIKDVPILDVGLGGTENVWLDNEGIYHHNTTPYLNVNGVSVKYDKLFFELIDKLLPEDYISSAGLDY